MDFRNETAPLSHMKNIGEPGLMLSTFLSTVQNCRERMGDLKGVDTFVAIRILNLIAEHAPISQMQLRRIAPDLSPTYVSRVFTFATQRGWMSKGKRDDNDHSLPFELTDAGQALLVSLLAPLEDARKASNVSGTPAPEQPSENPRIQRNPKRRKTPLELATEQCYRAFPELEE
jgi:hypothetical protein